jgi:hypothetical protein
MGMGADGSIGPFCSPIPFAFPSFNRSFSADHNRSLSYFAVIIFI